MLSSVGDVCSLGFVAWCCLHLVEPLAYHVLPSPRLPDLFFIHRLAPTVVYGSTWNACGRLFQISQLEKMVREAAPLFEAFKQSLAANTQANEALFCNGGPAKRARSEDPLEDPLETAVHLVAIILDASGRGTPSRLALLLH